MKSIIWLKTTTPSLLTRRHRYACPKLLHRCRRAKHCGQVTLALVCFGLLPIAQAVVPAPDGGYPGGNTAEGQAALLNRTTGGFNTAVGFLSLRSNTTGGFNTAIGAGTLLANTGNENTATGAGALLSNTGGGNTANGAFALVSNITGSFNTANGAFALFTNTAGNGNIATGIDALHHNTIGNGNTATGGQALLSNTTGNGNIALGFNAGLNLTTGDNNIDIGNVGVAGESGTIRIGGANQTATYVAGIAGQTVGAGGSTCYVDNDGKLGVFLSARRFKTDIADMAAASEGLLALRPVTFHYKPELDKTGIPQFGLVAEEVAKVNPDLVTHDAKGDIYTVRYEAVNAMLLNEFLKAHRRIEEQDRRIDQLTVQLTQQTALIQKVNDKVELNKSAQQTVLKNH
jgi:hypothetical protein